MIEYVHGNIFDSPAQTIVNPVNCMGAMGAGLARQFKERYPSMFEKYKQCCLNNSLMPGKLLLHKAEDHWILNFPTKDDWRDKSRISYIEDGLRKFVETYEQRGITSIAFTKLGCGLGGLDWLQVKPIMEQYLNHLPITVYLYV